MGQWPLTVQLMDGVLAQHPDHLLASLAKGQAEAALGQMPQAIATWKKGLAAAGGNFPPIEELLAEVEAGGGAGGAGAIAMAGAAPPAAAQSPAAAAAGGGAYRLHIELAPGTVAPRGAAGSRATLFVALRGDTPGPPAAVKRISNPTFPLELTLSVDDSMMGQPLPLEGQPLGQPRRRRQRLDQGARRSRPPRSQALLRHAGHHHPGERSEVK